MKSSPGVALFLALISLVFTSNAAAFDRAVETKNIRLLFQEVTEGYIAPYTLQTAENALRFYTRLFNYTPSEKVTVILADVADYGNAAAWTAPRNTVFIHMAPANFVYETGPANERMNFTMNHEMAHIAAHDQASGMDTFFRAIFAGKVRAESEHPETIVYSYLTSPRKSAPRWYHEGLAVFFETWMAGGIGRALGAYDEMVFRSMVKDGSRFYDPLGLESEGTRIDFQVGINSYLYGTRFMTYLAYRYAPEDLVTWASRSKGSKPYFSSQFKRVFGASLGDVWKDWVAFEQEFQQANLDSIRTHPVTQVTDLSLKPLGSVSRAFLDPEEEKLFVAINYPGTVGHVAAISTTDGSIEKLVEVKGPAIYFVTSLAYDPDTRTLFYTTDNDDWRDIWSFDLETRKATQLMKDARVGDIVFNRMDRSLWGVRHFNGYATLVRIPYPYTEWNQVLTWPYGQVMYDLDLSPDGKRLVASRAEINGRQTLIEMETDSLLVGNKSFRTLFNFGSSLPANFVYSPDADYLYGSSYYTGVSNVFRYNLAADSMDVVTNTETGLFRPLPVTADSLVVFRYTGDGFVPCTARVSPLDDVSAITFLGTELVKARPVVRDWLLPPPSTIDLDSTVTYAGDFKSLGNLGLASIYPIVQGYKDFAAVGLALNISDPSYTNTITASVSYTPADSLPADERLHAEVTYERAGWKLAFRQNGADFYDLFGPTKTSRKGSALGIGYQRNLVYDKPKTLDLRVGVTGYAGLESLPFAQNVLARSSEMITGYAMLDYKNQRASLGAVDFEKGVGWSLLSASSAVTDDFFTQVLGTLDFGFPLFAHSSVWLRSSAGYSPGKRDEPAANFYFGGFGNNYVDHQEVKRYREFYAFPGTELNAIGGTNYAKSFVEWNLPPIRFRRVGIPSFYATWLRTSLFAGGLVTNMDNATYRREAANAGAQIDLRIVALSNLNLTISFGYAAAVETDMRRTYERMFSVRIL